MQIMAEDTCYLIDPLDSDVDISTLFPIFENPSISKVVFSFREDLALMHTLGCFPQGLYDIGVAIRLLDQTQTSLGTVLEQFLDISVDKEAQTSNWFTRPLSEEQLSYATQDVLHLIPLQKVVAAQLEAKGVSDWVRQENEHWEQMDYRAAENAPLVKDKDKKDLNEVQWYVFQALMAYRESIAEELDIPPGRAMRTEYLKEILTKNGMRYWEKNRSTHNRIRKPQYKEEVQELVKRASAEAIAKGLSSEKNARARLSKEDYQASKERRWEKEFYLDNVAKPIQKELKRKHGEETAIFLLSNRLAADLLYDQEIPLPEYRKELIRAAHEVVEFDAEQEAVYAKTLGLI
jgi:ribonuclease D